MNASDLELSRIPDRSNDCGGSLIVNAAPELCKYPITTNLRSPDLKLINCDLKIKTKDQPAF